MRVFAGGREPLAFLRLAFLLTVVVVPASTCVGCAREWGSGSVRGVRLPHLVPAIITILLPER